MAAGAADRLPVSVSTLFSKVSTGCPTHQGLEGQQPRVPLRLWQALDAPVADNGFD